jgi:hypothetical protein
MSPLNARKKEGFAKTTKSLLSAFACLMCAWLMRSANFDPIDSHLATGQFFTVSSENFAARITWFPLFREGEGQKLLQRCEILSIRMMAQTLLCIA